jgi:Spy/CpxP family protein refolding chaperone
MPGPGMGPGMWGGVGNLPASVSAEQRSKIAEIQRDARKRQWPLMQQMHELMWPDAAGESGAFDEQAQRRDYDRMAALQKQMFDNMLDSRKRIEAVLTPQQREEMRRNPRPAG